MYSKDSGGGAGEDDTYGSSNRDVGSGGDGSNGSESEDIMDGSGYAQRWEGGYGTDYTDGGNAGGGYGWVVRLPLFVMEKRLVIGLLTVAMHVAVNAAKMLRVVMMMWR